MFSNPFQAESMLIGTGGFSNCKACGRKVSFKLRHCPHCREPDPQLKNSLGWRVNYTKELDPTVSSKWESIWLFQPRIKKRLAISISIAIIVVAITVEYLSLDSIISYYGWPEELAKNWASFLSMIMYFVLAICVATALKH